MNQDTVEYGYNDKGEVMQNRDILKNLSRLKGTCIVCGRTITDTAMPWLNEAWVECECGNIVRLDNTNRWN